MQLTKFDRGRGSTKLAARYSAPHRVLASHNGGAFFDVLDLQTGIVRRLGHRLLRRFTPSALTPEISPDPYYADLYLPRANGTTKATERRGQEPEAVARLAVGQAQGGPGLSLGSDELRTHRLTCDGSLGSL